MMTTMKAQKPGPKYLTTAMMMTLKLKPKLDPSPQSDAAAVRRAPTGGASAAHQCARAIARPTRESPVAALRVVTRKKRQSGRRKGKSAESSLFSASILKLKQTISSGARPRIRCVA
jgi:hypothetical protein